MTEKERNELIARRIGAGISMSDIQKELEEEHGISMTYMDLRMLVADLEEINWKKPEVEPVVEEPEIPVGIAAPATDPVDEIEVNISKIVRPGYMLSGDVTFRSGIKGDWFVDQYGRMGLDPKGDVNPTEEELLEFQQVLQQKVSNGGIG